jgi:hypothetical protein
MEASYKKAFYAKFRHEENSAMSGQSGQFVCYFGRGLALAPQASRSPFAPCQAGRNAASQFTIALNYEKKEGIDAISKIVLCILPLSRKYNRGY